MTLLTRHFLPLKASLTRFKASFSFSRPFILKTDSVNFGLFLTEVLHQRNITWANPGTGPAFNTILKVVRRGLIMLLTFTKPVQLLRQKIGWAGISASTAADTAFFFLLLTHLIEGWREQAVSYFDHRHIQPWKGKAHQGATHNDHLLGRRVKTSEFQQMTHRGTQPRPDITRSGDSITGQRDNTLRQWLTVNNRPFNRISSADVLH